MAIPKKLISLWETHRVIEEFTNNVFLCYLKKTEWASVDEKRKVAMEAYFNASAGKDLVKLKLEWRDLEEKLKEVKIVWKNLEDLAKMAEVEAIKAANDLNLYRKPDKGKVRKYVLRNRWNKLRALQNRLRRDLVITQLEMIRSVFFIQKVKGINTRWVRGLSVKTDRQKSAFKMFAEFFDIETITGEQLRAEKLALVAAAAAGESSSDDDDDDDDDGGGEVDGVGDDQPEVAAGVVGAGEVGAGVVATGEVGAGEVAAGVVAAGEGGEVVEAAYDEGYAAGYEAGYAACCGGVEVSGEKEVVNKHIRFYNDHIWFSSSDSGDD